MPRGMFVSVYYTAQPLLCLYRIACIYAYRRGVCVARFDQSGNAKTSKRETGNRYRFSRFFILNT